MAALSRSRRASAGIAFIIGGALVVLGVILSYTPANLGGWVWLAAYLALAVGFAILAVGSIGNTAARIALAIAAVGWGLLAIAAIGSLPGGIGTLAAVAAALGGLIGAILLYTGREVTDRSAVAFIVATAAAAILLIAGVAAIAIGVLGTLLTVLMGAGFFVTGLLFRELIRNR